MGRERRPQFMPSDEEEEVAHPLHHKPHGRMRAWDYSTLGLCRSRSSPSGGAVPPQRALRPSRSEVSAARRRVRRSHDREESRVDPEWERCFRRDLPLRRVRGRDHDWFGEEPASLPPVQQQLLGSNHRGRRGRRPVPRPLGKALVGGLRPVVVRANRTPLLAKGPRKRAFGVSLFFQRGSELIVFAPALTAAVLQERIGGKQRWRSRISSGTQFSGGRLSAASNHRPDCGPTE